MTWSGALRGAGRAALTTAAISSAVGRGALSLPIEARTIRVGVAGGSPRWILSTCSMPPITRPNTVYSRSIERRGANMM
jgi:hypothetical protein